MFTEHILCAETAHCSLRALSPQLSGPGARQQLTARSRPAGAVDRQGRTGTSSQTGLLPTAAFPQDGDRSGLKFSDPHMFHRSRSSPGRAVGGGVRTQGWHPVVGPALKRGLLGLGSPEPPWVTPGASSRFTSVTAHRCGVCSHTQCI